MNYRTALLLPSKDPGGDGTETININIPDVISRLTLEYRTDAASKAQSQHLAANIERIELVNGSDVLVSLTGRQVQALAFFDRRIFSLNEGNVAMGGEIAGWFPLDFGRYLWDPELALDPKRYPNLQLKIEYNEDLCDTGVTDHWLQVWADLFDEKPVSPQGFLAPKQYYIYQCGAENSYENIDLPRDRIIRRMMLRGYYRRTALEATIAEMRLDENNQKRIVFDWEMWRYIRYIKTVSQPILEGLTEYANEAGEYDKYVMSTDYQTAWLATPEATSGCYQNDYANGGFVQRQFAGTSMAIGMVYGWHPHHCIDIPFGDPQNIDDWYNPAEKDRVRLRLKAGSNGTNGEASVLLQQLRRD